MAYRSFTLVVIVGPVLAFSCGGKTSGDGDGGPGSSSSSGGVSNSSSGSGSGGEPIDATPTIDSPASIVCTSNGMSGSSGGGETDGGPPPCMTSASETCSDGNTYHVNIQCPAAVAVCYVTSSSGSSGGDSVMYPGCPSCTQLSEAYSACGFPQ